MKKIEAIVQPLKFENIKKQLYKMGISGVTVSNVEGYGFQKRKMDVLKDKDVKVEFQPKIKIEIVLKEDEVDGVLDAIIDVTRTGRIGDGKIFITDLHDVVRIRTGERGEDAV